MESNTKQWIEDAIQSVSKTADVNTVIGEPVTLPNGVTIVPFSKVSVGLATGGTDRNPKRETEKNLFAGGGGAGVSVTPLGFLVVGADGSVKLLDLANPDSYVPKANPVEKLLSGAETLLDRAPEVLSRCKEAFGKKKDTSEADKTEEETEEGR